MTFIAGAFSATFGALPLGTTEDGFELSFNRIQEEIRVDQYRGLVDAVHQGIDMSIRFVLTEANYPVIEELLWNTSNANNVQGRASSSVGGLISTVAKALILTPCAGTTAAAQLTNAQNQIDGITFAKVVLATDPVAVKFAASLRRIPITAHILPSWTVSPGDDPWVGFPGCNTNANGNLEYYSIA